VGRIFRKNVNNKRNFESNNANRINWNLIREVRLIDENDNMVGIVPTPRALEMARDAGLELINISSNAVPPVCKICDYGKYRYAQQKKQKNNKTNLKFKEIQFSMHIDEHDLLIKLKKAIEFLQNKYTVQLAILLKGRDMPRVDVAMELMQRVCQKLKEHAKQVDEPKITGRKIIALCR